jgi:hypothetical protein
MFALSSINAAQIAAWQTGTAIVQAVVSVSLLGWYVLAARLDRARMQREKTEDFDSLVRLCRDLGAEAEGKTRAHCTVLADAVGQGVVDVIAVRKILTDWQADMTVVYVCLNEVPHYEVRNPGFSTALTRLWLAVDSRAVAVDHFADPQNLQAFLNGKFEQICTEVDAMASLLNVDSERDRRPSPLVAATGRRGYAYGPDGHVR